MGVQQKMERWDEEPFGEKISTTLKRRTKFLLQEIKKLSGMTWEEMYLKISVAFPAPIDTSTHSTKHKLFVNSVENLKKLGNGTQHLSEEFLPILASWAIKKKWGGEVAKATKLYQPRTRQEIEQEENFRRHQQYRDKLPLHELIANRLIKSEQERGRAAEGINEALFNMVDAGFSHADILYMVHCWLKLHPPSIDSPTSKLTSPIYSDPGVENFFNMVDMEHLPNDFVLPEHKNGKTYRVSCLVYTFDNNLCLDNK